jgi:hypothetical protein
MWFATNEEGRVCAYAEENCLEGGMEFDYPEDMTADTMSDWVIRDGELIHDPLPVVPTRLDDLEAVVSDLWAASALAE